MRKLRHRGLRGIHSSVAHICQDGACSLYQALGPSSLSALTLELLPSFQQETSNKKMEDQRPQNKNPGIQTLPDPV